MSVLATDNFNRSNGTLGANWTTVSGQGSLNVQGNVCQVVSVGSDAYAFYNAATWPNDQWSQIKLTTLNSSSVAAGALVRTASAANSFYSGMANGNFGASKTIDFIKYVAGTRTVKASTTATIATGDQLYIEAQGTTVIVKLNGSTIITNTDTSLASGSAGAGSFVDAGAQSDGQLDDWQGGDFGGGTTTIGNTRALSYDIYGTVGNSRALSFNIAGLVGNARSLSFDLYATIGNTRALSFDIYTAAGNSRALSYDIYTTIGNSRALSFDLYAVVGNSRTFTYDLAGPVGNTRAIAFDVLTSTGNSRALSFDIYTPAGNARALTFNILAAVGNGRTVSWQVESNAVVMTGPVFAEFLANELELEFEAAELGMEFGGAGLELEFP